MSTSNNMFKPRMPQKHSEPPLPSSVSSPSIGKESDTSTSPVEDIKVVEKWDEMELPEDVLRGIYSYGYEKPSPIQKRAICPMLSERDMIAQAQSGTGKTATFSIGSMSRIDLAKRQTQVLCLAPTRELTMQIANVYKTIGTFLS